MFIYWLDATNKSYQIVFSEFSHGAVIISPVAQVGDGGEGDAVLHFSISDVVSHSLSLAHVDTTVITLLPSTVRYNLREKKSI